MKYQFPQIRHFKDIEGALNENFFVAEKQGYKVVNYFVNHPEVFPSVTDENSAIAREFRGLIFDLEGNIVRRPLHKFFNLNERAETQNLDFNQPHVILEKLDGSMIAFYRIGDKEVWGTKMGETDVSNQVELWLKQEKSRYDSYSGFANELFDLGYTTIFEWCSPTQRIVLDYKYPQLILTAIRHIKTGEYLNIHNF